MQVKGIVWFGTRTANFGEMVSFLEKVLGAEVVEREEDVVVFELPDGDVIEVFAPDAPGGGHPDGMATGFLVEDAGRARAELEAVGAEVGDLHAEGGWTWAYFRAPDGNLYGIAHRV